MTTSISINGLGRIGRTILRQISTKGIDTNFRITRINDIAGLEMIAYLLRFDSIFGPFPGNIETTEDTIIINGQKIPFSTSATLNIDLSDTDILLDCTGKAHTPEFAQLGLKAGSKKVLISGPSPAAEVTIVFDVNEHELSDSKIISNASCTTNAVAPLLKSLDDKWGIESAHITTIHCYTGSQPMIDAPRVDMARSRAGALSMVPTTTSAMPLIKRVLPHLAERISCAALRVPTASVSAIDLVAQVCNLPKDNLETHIQALADASTVMGWTQYQNVSCDMRAHSESIVLALRETQRVGDRQLRILGWYDNEWGFSARMLDVAELMNKK
ncbi:MAG: glyceraldehyde-3-phosphate dehydrogenase [Aestuariivita sp.]|nr:glyceraldehyde-3-phosphate dehydrogenase [Aestuariivita sp.]